MSDQARAEADAARAAADIATTQATDFDPARDRTEARAALEQARQREDWQGREAESRRLSEQSRVNAQRIEAEERRRRDEETRAAGRSFTPETSLASAYTGFLATPAPSPAPVQAPAAPAAGPDLSQVNSLIQQLTTQATEGRARQERQAAAMRELLQGRIKEASAPVDVNAPNLRPVLAAQRLARQRSSERQRSQVAARLSREGLLDSGAFDTALSGIEQARGEGESADIAATLAPEQQARRQELLSLYQMALSQGDNDAARAIQEQLAALGAAQGVASLGEQRRQFDTSFGEGQRRFAADEAFRRSSFLDNLRLAMAR